MNLVSTLHSSFGTVQSALSKSISAPNRAEHFVFSRPREDNEFQATRVNGVDVSQRFHEGRHMLIRHCSEVAATLRAAA